MDQRFRVTPGVSRKCLTPFLVSILTRGPRSLAPPAGSHHGSHCKQANNDQEEYHGHQEKERAAYSGDHASPPPFARTDGIALSHRVDRAVIHQALLQILFRIDQFLLDGISNGNREQMEPSANRSVLYLI